MLQRAARSVRRAGRFGDTHLVHINERELGYLSRIWGKPSTNPKTGLPEFFDFGSFLGQYIAPAAASYIGAPLVGDALGNFAGDYTQTLAGAGIGALTSGALNGFNAGNLAGGAAIGGVTPNAANVVGMQGFQNPFNVPTLFDLPGSLGMGGSPVGTGSGGGAYGGPADLGGGPNSPALGSTTDNGSWGLNGAGAGAGGGLKGAASSGLSWLAKNPGAALTALGALAALSSPKAPATAAPATTSAAAVPTSWQNYRIPTLPFQRTQNTGSTGQPANPNGGEYNFYSNNQLPTVPISTNNQGVVMAARGGALSMPHGFASGGGHGPRFVKGPGDGRDDAIDAKLSNDEYVVDAESVALLGNGSPEAGAKKLDQFRSNLRRQKGKALAKGKFSPDAHKTVQGYLGRAA